MTAIGVALMGAGVWVILGSPDLSGATLLGAVLFLLGLWMTAHSAPSTRTRPRDSTARALDDAAAELVDR